ncbi:hypothetical protein [Vibrio phage vB_VibM_83AMN]|nr:hypothetical protein [Vibrio phage vB_VibM_83AMN]
MPNKSKSVPFKGTYNECSMKYMDSLKVTKIKDHVYEMFDPATNESWFDFTDEASLFFGRKYQTAEDAEKALNQYIKHLG